MIDNGSGDAFMLQSSRIIEQAKRLGNLYAGVIEENLNSFSAQELARRILKCEAERGMAVMEQFPVENAFEENHNNPLCVYCDEPRSKYCKETGRLHICLCTEGDVAVFVENTESTGKEDSVLYAYEEECCVEKKIDGANYFCTSRNCSELNTAPPIVSSDSSSPPSRSASHGVPLEQPTASLIELKEGDTPREMSTEIVEVGLSTSP